MPDTQVLALLCAIRADISQMKGDIAEIKERIGLAADGFASLAQRMDRVGADVEKVRKRLA